MCSRVSSVSAESRVWELCVELDKGVHMLGVSRSGNNYKVSENVQKNYISCQISVYLPVYLTVVHIRLTH